MALKDGNAYRESLKVMKTVVYAFGERIENFVDPPLFRPHINAASLTYDLAHDPAAEDLVATTSHLNGQRISRFTHIHQSTDDLVKKVKMLRMIAGKTGSCFQRCVGFDAMNATYGVTYEMDQELGTNYHARFRQYLEYIQANDLMVAGSMTDAKGDLSVCRDSNRDPPWRRSLNPPPSDH